MRKHTTSQAVNYELTARIISAGNPKNHLGNVRQVASQRKNKEGIIAVIVLAAVATAVFTLHAFGLIPTNI